MTRPKVDNAPGLIWRPFQDGWEARWQARTDLIARGFEPKSQRVWTGIEPTRVEASHISDICNRLQDEMKIFGRGGLPMPATTFDGTLKSLINCYQTDPNSRYHKKRYSTRRNHDSLLRRIAERHGLEEIKDIKARTILAWYEEWSDHGRMPATWQSIRGLLRVLFSFGFALLEDPECDRLCRVMGSRALQFEAPKSRNQAITADQATAVRKEARDHFGWHSMALAQALQFELMLRQKDVIGEWVPLSEPGLSDITWKNQKWIRGLRWEEIDENFILIHTTSKRQKILEVDLRLAPMVMEEFGLIADMPTSELVRSMLPATGALVYNTITAAPWGDSEFRRKWRKVANRAGIPPYVFNMDSRAGGITEASDAGADMEHIRQAATHSDIAMTQKYNRNTVAKVSNVMRIRVEGRNKPKT